MGCGVKKLSLNGKIFLVGQRKHELILVELNQDELMLIMC